MNSFIRDNKACRGMSLVELLLVMAILSVVMLAVISLYVPAHQSTVAQTQVSDVQSNLRLALDRMTRDLLTAGFLAPGQPIVFETTSAGTPAANPADDKDFTIRTRLVSSGFARVASATGNGDLVVTVTDSEMTDRFVANTTWVRLFNPMTARECAEYDESNAISAAAHVYKVVAKTATTLTIDTNAAGKVALSGDSPANVFAETVILRVSSENEPPLQTIRYMLNNGTLQRIVNGDPQLLARNVNDAVFTYESAATGRIQKVNIALSGQTKALKNDAISGVKTRALQTSVTLRNVF